MAIILNSFKFAECNQQPEFNFNTIKESFNLYIKLSFSLVDTQFCLRFQSVKMKFLVLLSAVFLISVVYGVTVEEEWVNFKVIPS